MKRKIGNSLYKQLLIRIIMFLILPLVVTLSTFIISNNIKTQNSYDVSIELMMEHARTTRETHIINVHEIVNSIRMNNIINGFFLMDFVKENLRYYTTQIASIINSSYLDNNYKVCIYYENDTIPRGLGSFYYISDLKKLNHFVNSSDEKLWITPSESSLYQSELTTFENNYTYLEKVYINDKLLYIIAVSVPVKLMDHFLEVEVEYPDSQLDGRELYESRECMVINMNKEFPIQVPYEGEVEEFLSTVDQSSRVERMEFDNFPQDIVYVFPKFSVNQYSTYFIICIIMILLIFILLIFRFISKMFGSIYRCIEQFSHSVTNGFVDKLKVEGDDEIAEIVATFNTQIDRIQELIEVTIKQENIVKETQIKMLQHQINPHFLYNTLEVFSYKMELYGHEEEANAIVSFSNMLRYNVSDYDKYTSLGNELVQIDNYMNIQTLKYKDVRLVKEIPEHLLDKKLLKFTLQPIIENCFVHGYRGIHFEIRLRVVDQDDYLHFEVIDNGRGISLEGLKAINNDLDLGIDNNIGIGLSNINNRMKCFSKKEDVCGLRIDSEEGSWTKVTWQIQKEVYDSKNFERGRLF